MQVSEVKRLTLWEATLYSRDKDSIGGRTKVKLEDMSNVREKLRQIRKEKGLPEKY